MGTLDRLLLLPATVRSLVVLELAGAAYLALRSVLALWQAHHPAGYGAALGAPIVGAAGVTFALHALVVSAAAIATVLVSGRRGWIPQVAGLLGVLTFTAVAITP